MDPKNFVYPAMLPPLFADAGPLPAGESLWKQALVVAGRVLLLRMLDWMARQYNREAFFLTTLAAVFIAAWPWTGPACPWRWAPS